MRTYWLRDEKGVAKAKLSSRLAHEVFATIDGHWRERQTKNHTSRVYEIDNDAVFGDRHIRLFFWKGDFIIESRNS